jgi:hypothetical protein
LVAENTAVRDGWYKALQERIAEAGTLKDEILNKDSYKETLDKLRTFISLVLTANSS